MLFLLPQWCLILPPRDKATKHKVMQVQLKHFLVGDWENLQEFFLWAQVLATSLNSMPFPQHDPPIHKCFLHSLIIRRAKQYS